MKHRRTAILSTLVSTSLVISLMVPAGAFAVEEQEAVAEGIVGAEEEPSLPTQPVEPSEDIEEDAPEGASDSTLSQSEASVLAGAALDAAQDGPSEDAVLTAADPRDEVLVEVNDAQTQATITADIAALADAAYVEFPTWSATNGQDDIVWYRANSKNAQGKWEVVVDLGRHASLGTFYVHVYAMVGGTFGMHGATSFSLVTPSADVEITQSDAQRKAGTFDVVMTNVASRTPILRVQIPTWSSANGQDDIVWYDAVRTYDGYAVRDIPCIGSRRAPGEYVSHVYATLQNNAVAFVCGTAKAVEVPGATLSAALDATCSRIEIEATGGLFDLASSVQFPTWSLAGGQDDLRWYRVDGRSAGAWKLSVPLSVHRDAGDYAIHAYALIGGAQVFAGAASTSVPKPTCDVAIVQDKVAGSGTTQKQAGTFDIEVTNLVVPSTATRVQVPTWSSANGQDDIVWYDAVKDGSAWVVRNVPCVNARRSAGEYVSHVYVTCANGVFSFAKAASATVEVADPTIDIVNVDGKDTRFAITLKGGRFAGADAVQVPTWSARDGQDDIVWYAAQRQADGSWTTTVDITRHRTVGAYNVHAYATHGGALAMVGAASFEVSAPQATVSSVLDDAAGTITVTVSGIVSPSGVTRVQVPTWTNLNGQDDVDWCTAQSQGDGSYKATIHASSHNGEEGPYISHIYVTCGNGVMGYVGAIADQRLSLSDYVFVTGSMGSGVRFVNIKNPSASGAVRVPTWSVTGGQDDIVWYSANAAGDGLYQARIDCHNLRHEGTVISHIYAGDTMVGATSFAVNANDIWTISGDPVLDGYLREVIRRYGANPRTLYDYMMTYPYINGSKYPTGNWTIPFAKEMYERRGGNCYRYASLYCWLLRAAGYDANAISGYISSRIQGWAPHGWVEVYINGTTYVCDPNIGRSYPNRNFYMITYATAPFTYKK